MNAGFQTMTTVKVAFQMEGRIPLLTEINLDAPVSAAVQKVCNEWNISNFEQYTLQISPDSKTIHRGNLLNDTNKHFIKVGSILLVVKSPVLELGKCVEAFKQDPLGKSEPVLDLLRSFSTDLSFAREFVSVGAYKFLEHAFISLVGAASAKSSEEAKIAKIASALIDFNLHKILTDQDVSFNILDLLKQQKKLFSATNLLLTSYYNLLASYLQAFPNMYLQIAEIANPGILHTDLSQTLDLMLQFAIINCFASLFICCPDAHKPAVREFILTSEFKSRILTLACKSDELNAREKQIINYIEYIILYPEYLVTQTILKKNQGDNLSEDTKLYLKKLHEIYTKAFLTSNANKSIDDDNAVHNFKKLGSPSADDPLELFYNYPGTLTVDCLEFYASHYQENFAKMATQNSGFMEQMNIGQSRAAPQPSSSEPKKNTITGSTTSSTAVPAISKNATVLPWSIFSVSVALTMELVNMFSLFDQLSFDYRLNVVHPSLFSTSEPFKQLFAIVLQLFNKSWNDMNVAQDGIGAVASLCREQLIQAFARVPSTLDKLNTCLDELDYATVMLAANKERNEVQLMDSKSYSVRYMKNHLRPTIIDCITQQRLAFMKKGTVFGKSKSKKGGVFVLLHPNHDKLLYAESDEPLDLSHMSNKLELAEISSISAGGSAAASGAAAVADSNIISAKTLGKKTTNVAAQQLQITIIANESNKSLELMAKTSLDYDYWFDGLNSLLGKNLYSPKFSEEFNELLELGLKINLFELDGVNIPEEPPPLPALPNNFDFVLKEI